MLDMLLCVQTPTPLMKRMKTIVQSLFIQLFERRNEDLMRQLDVFLVRIIPLRGAPFNVIKFRYYFKNAFVTAIVTNF